MTILVVFFDNFSVVSGGRFSMRTLFGRRVGVFVKSHMGSPTHGRPPGMFSPDKCSSFCGKQITVTSVIVEIIGPDTFPCALCFCCKLTLSSEIRRIHIKLLYFSKVLCISFVAVSLNLSVFPLNAAPFILSA